MIITKSCFWYDYLKMLLFKNTILITKNHVIIFPIILKRKEMKKIILIAGVALLTWNTQGVANELDELGEITLIDESAQSNLFQKGKIVGCSDHLRKKELTCSKKPEDAIILSKLPTSSQLNEIDLEDEKDSKSIQAQLISVIEELSQLKKEQRADRNTIKELKALVKILSEKKTHTPKNRITSVKKRIRNITKKHQPKTPKKFTATRIKKPINEVEVYSDHVVIQVQNNESLSTYAQVYYHDNTKYYRIYKANKNKINKNLQIVIGDRLIIPGAKSYKE